MEEIVTPEIDYKAKYQALSKDVSPDFVDDALVLAQRRMTDEVDLETALDQVLDSYPHFKRQAPVNPTVQTATATQTAMQTAPLSTGIHTGGKTPALSGVEAAFLRKNPNIKL
jgi:hypothetical protein